ncbi:hypothetical protein TBLA_0H00190 [Henningerozyma blattae CBS 6284]|uniref:Uncharacterized protein n=1 Tax=Henningerozyma blattae (strain ATCC 34711 / CBS 6284 / DSM 70876 / NBRC 10599 / NRRL Y-10934 / UCD 77-7) TaxID=1071380 RepID=I2H7G0_HENB6|nr:hypothetical protein TBLA_0H00190 [Tetrapisispora blattae CBS 6284]CCH62312.1 hypothetical protein TBLA_0H00190 [Tetrapisispora blattae CBS 6284]
MGGTIFHRKTKEEKYGPGIQGAAGDEYDEQECQQQQEQQQQQDEVDASEFEDDDILPPVVRNRRPKENKFTQQRLAAIDPVFTPSIVVPLYLLIAVVFVIVGGCLLSVSSRVNEIKLYYEECSTQAPTNDWGDMPKHAYDFYYHQYQQFNVSPQWKFVDDPNDDFHEKGTCQIRFTVPIKFKNTVFVNYLLEKFYANHRRYVLSYNEDQIRGKPASYHDVHGHTGINCKPLSRNNENGKVYYPCGLIANSMFNDTYPMELVNVQDPTNNYQLTNKGINYHSDRERFRKTRYNHTEISPPPNWVRQFPNGYNETNIPDIQDWEEFQNWMRPAAFDKFAKLIRRNHTEDLLPGVYQIDIGLHWPVTEFHGRKAVYITHSSQLGGKNPFLGIVYLIGGCLCCAMAVTIVGFYMISSRRIADPSQLSWNRPKLN